MSCAPYDPSDHINHLYKYLYKYVSPNSTYVIWKILISGLLTKKIPQQLVADVANIDYTYSELIILESSSPASEVNKEYWW